MGHEWVFDVLKDLVDYGIANPGDQPDDLQHLASGRTILIVRIEEQRMIGLVCAGQLRHIGSERPVELARLVVALLGGQAIADWIDNCPNAEFAALTYQGGAAWRARLMADNLLTAR